MKTFIQPFHSLSGRLHNFDDIALRAQYFDRHNLLRTRWHTEGNSFVAEIPVPGMCKEDLNIDLEDSALIISTKNSTKSKENIKNLSYSSFKHFLTLPDGVDTNSIKARCRNGLLTITIDKKESAKKRTVIKVHGPDDSTGTGRLDSMWSKIKEKMDVRKFVHNLAHH